MYRLSSFPILVLLLAAFTFHSTASGAKPVAGAAKASRAAVTGLVLINTATQQPIRALLEGDTINVAQEGTALNVRADVTGTVGSVSFLLDGAQLSSDNTAPYAIAGDDAGVYRTWTPTVGTHTLRAVPTARTNGAGTPGTAYEVSFTVINPALPPPPLAITNLILINATTQQDIRVLQPDDVIELSADGTALNIRAEFSGPVASVSFAMIGASTTIDSGAPFAAAGDTGGVYSSWTPAVGNHTLRVIPYPLQNGGGTPGPAFESAFTVANTPPPVDPLTGLSLYNATGELNVTLYNQLAYNYDKASMEMRFGPSFADLSPDAVDDRPTLFRPTSIPRTSGYVRTNPYELGGPPVTDGDYWSDSGQVGYVPDVATDPGLDRIQTYAYYDRVFAISPRLDWASGRPHPEPLTQYSYYGTLFGELPKYPIAMQRNFGMQQNEALVLFRDGYLAVAPTQTSRASGERPYPGMVFPAHKVPTAIAVTTGNEFALVTIWDVNTRKGQLAVIALEGKYLAFHTWPYIAMPNQGSWSAFKLLGYIDLPMAMPTSVSAASNGWWSGPSQTAGLVLSQIDLANETHRKNLYSGAWDAVVAKGGYAIVGSKYDNTAVVVDLAPLLSYVRESYLSSAESYQATMAARGPADENFPQAFSVRPTIAPRVVWQQTVAQPNCVLAGMKIDRWSHDFHKGYIASADGTIHIIDTSSLMWRFSWEQKHAIGKIGSFNVGRNPTGMCFTRRKDRDLPLIPLSSTGTQYDPDPLNNLFYVAVRGDRKVVAAVTWAGAGAVYRTIQDSRMGDPVAVSTAVRGPILSVADFRGRKILSFRIGTINDNRNGVSYGCGPEGTDPFELAGELPFSGYPFLVNSSNVN